jgi:hypothetical protein
VRLDLEFSKALDCDGFHKIVVDAARNADQRSTGALAALKQTNGCGSDKNSDCYPCLRSADDLAVALQTAAEHPGPRFEAGRYVPAP